VSEITASPLCWPPGWRRCKSRTSAKFGKSVSVKNTYSDGYHTSKRELSIEDGTRRILGELGRMGIASHKIIISSDLRLRNDGLPYSNQATSKLDPGVAVYWQDGSQRRCMAIDRYDRIADNLAAIAATIEAMRAIERHGGAEILDRAFTGFAALPAPAAQDAPHEVLGVSENATAAEIDYAYRRLAQQCHPDVGGSHEAMTRINTARDAMLARAP
jgi:hypothetical protein